MLKIIGVGNILLGDDGIGVHIVEKIKNKVTKLNNNIDIIAGETDYVYCLNEINKEDTIIIIDSISTNEEVGKVSLFNLKECERFSNYHITNHEINLVDALIYEEKNINAYLIGIEIKEINYSLDLSINLKYKLNEICEEVLGIINKLINNI